MTLQTRVDVGETLAEAKLGPKPIFVLFLAFLVVMLDGYDLLCLAFVAPSLSKVLGLDVASFGPIFTAAFVGIMIGGLSISPFGDKFGRKIILVASVAMFGFFSLLPLVDLSYSHLIVYRFMTGLGLGGAMPGAVALVSEYAPRRFKGLFVNLMFAGVATGAVLGGLLASQLIPLYGWQSAFWIGGVAPLLMAAVLAAVMPESIAYLAATEKRPAYIAAMLNSMNPKRRYSTEDVFVISEGTKTDGGQIRALFQERRAAGTLLLWLIAFTGLFANNTLASWLPAIMTTQGLPLQTGILGPVMMNLGGILGTVLLGSLFTRLGATVIIAGALAMTAIGTLFTSQALFAAGPILPSIFVTGMFLLGSVNSNNTLMSAFYPTNIRSTGVGWALGMGRVGGAIGPGLAGIILAQGLGAATIFYVTAGVLTIGVFASITLGILYPVHRQPEIRPRAAEAPARAHLHLDMARRDVLGFRLLRRLGGRRLSEMARKSSTREREQWNL
jgi:MFS transporter, AAHS family, 4-hydroxybenzoate transporter